jgi:hypothetical protein
VTAGSEKRVWWRCKTHREHEWQAQVIARTSGGTGCPYCAGKKVCSTNSLEDLHPAIAKEWHPTKNRGLSPADVIVRTKKKVWWLCADCRNAWRTTVGSRVARMSGCPYCARKRAGTNKSLLNSFPEIAEQWHPTRNRPLKPENVAAYSNQNFWWKCKRGRDHIWQARVNNRTANRNGCPFCVGQRASVTNSLATLYPELAQEWHPKRNGELQPTDVTRGSRKRVWWRCPFNRRHEWEVSIADRVRGGTGCPLCYRLGRSAKSKSK